MLRKLRNKLLLFNMLSLTAVMVASFAVIFFMQFQLTRSADAERLAEIPIDVITNAMLERRNANAQAYGTMGPDGATAGAIGEGDPSGADAAGGISGGEGLSGGTGGQSESSQRPESPFIDNSGPDLALDYSSFFVLNVDTQGELSAFSRVELSDDQYIKAAEMARGHNSGVSKTGEIKLGGSHWLYSYSARVAGNMPLSDESLSQIALSGLPVNESIVFLNIDSSDKAMKRLLLNMFILGACVIAGLFIISLLLSNRALKPTEEGLRRQRRFIADASHELKTPLAIIDANAEAALAEPAESAVWIGRIADESERMRGLIEDLLFLARSEDAAAVPLETLPFDLSAAAEREIGSVEAVLFERGITLESKMPSGSGVIVNSDSARVRQVILILLDNAMKYTDRGGHITVETGIVRRFGFIKVSNTGEGISAADMPHIFDRFYRADRSRTSQGGSAAPGGYGLGLSIAKAIAERAGGKISAESENGLTAFTVELPLA
ncbi:MAG: HAMP domain-containing histidine kinase [Clostridiales Family XIII bacterium]|jgi:signal transduction histidine kinase|nr:HAMP domain-containing histidine kinase [Clostridiales Family XIII bacterium]